MAARRGGGGAKGSLFNGLWIIVVIGIVLAVGKANNIDSVESGLDFAKNWGKAVQKCAEETGKKQDLVNCAEKNIPDLKTNGGGSTKDSPLKLNKNAKQITKTLNSLTVATDQKVSYNRTEWSHWSDLDKNGCDSREDVLISQGKNVKADMANGCKIVSGSWVDPYSGTKIDKSSSIDIDHVIPLAYAARHGGQNWSKEKKEQFANDTSVNLIAASATENRKKSDKGPSGYMPPKVEFTCAYSSLWVEVAAKYGLSITKEDKDVLALGLSSCK